MRKIVVINQSSGYLAVDIANAFMHSGKYDDVVLVTGSPKEKLIGLNSKIAIHPIKRYNMNSTFSRFVSWIIAFLQILLCAKTRYKGYYLFIVSNPPIDSFLHLFCKNKFSTLIYDIYPDGLGNFVSKSSFIYKMWVKNNVIFYKKAERVFTLTESMKQTLSKYCTSNKIEIVPVWASESVEKPDISKQNIFLESHPELKGKFIVMYSGNIGLDHDLKCLVDAVSFLKNADIVLVFIGEGYNKQFLLDYVKERGLQDKCYFYPFQSFAVLPYSLSSASIGVVATKPNGRSSSIPSKAFNLIQLQVPLLSIAHPESEISLLVKKHIIGETFMTNQANEIAHFLDSMHDNPLLLEEYKNNERLCAPLYTKKLAEIFVQ